MTHVNVAAHLPRMAGLQPDGPAVICQHWDGGTPRYEQLTFAELNTRTDRIAHSLAKLGLARGTRTVLMVKPSPAFFALTFALFKIGAVPVLVDPGLGIRNLSVCLNEAEPEAFIGIPKAHIARVLLGWGRRTLKTLVTVGSKFGWGGSTLVRLERDAPADPFPMAETRPDEHAAILFTSGSTGSPKGAQYTHGIFSTQVEVLRSVYGIEPGERDLATFPLFALFGPALGMTAIVPDMDASRPASADPARLVRAIDDWKATNLFGSPALIDRLGRYCVEQKRTLPTLKRALSAGAPVAASVLERLSQCLSPGAQVFTPYGATEALPVCSMGSEEILRETRFATERGGGVCVGRPVGEVKLEIIETSDKAIPKWSPDLLVADGEIGEIAVKGPIVTSAYFNRPEATALAKIADPAGGFWHRMGDLGHRDEQGRIWFCGRKSHRVRTREGTLYTIPVEGVFNTHPAVRRTALVGVGKPGEQVPVLCVELNADSKNADKEKLVEELREIGAKFDHTRGIRPILFHPSFPVDIRHNAKIFREKLAVWADGKVGR